MDAEILVSVVIPVKNGDSWLNETIPSILNQQIAGAIEIIAIDSGSTDNSLSILSKYPVTVINIKPEEFNHGLTRNLGASYAKGKYIVMTVQDAKPVSQFWLQQLMDGFMDDTVAGVCGQQVVPHHRDKNPVEWYRPISTPVVRKEYFPVAASFSKLPLREQLAICRWDDVTTMYRKDLFSQLHFRETDFAEDALWAKDALLAGHAIVFNPLAQVEHYHHEDYNFAFKRNFIIQYHFYKYFGVVPDNSRSLLRMLRTTKLLIKEPAFSLAEKWKWLRYNYRNQRAVNQSNAIFLKSLATGNGQQLDLLYREICGLVPQALKLAR